MLYVNATNDGIAVNWAASDKTPGVAAPAADIQHRSSATSTGLGGNDDFPKARRRPIAAQLDRALRPKRKTAR